MQRGSAGRQMAELVGWIAAGAAVFGLGGLAIATAFVSEVPPVAGLGAGIAIGGGFGAVVRLLAFERVEETEDLTIEPDRSVTDVPAPEPADLFEASPDPMLYYADDGDGPVVRAANPAFAETFDVPVDDAIGTELAEMLATSDPQAVVDAAAAGTSFDDTRSCATSEDERPFRIRVVPVDVTSGTRGYVVYTPVE